MCFSLLEHDDSVSLPRATGKAKRGAALPGKSSAGLYQRGAAQLDSFSEAWCFEHLCSRRVLEFHQSKLGRQYRRVSQPAFTRGAKSRASQPRAIEAGVARA